MRPKTVLLVSFGCIAIAALSAAPRHTMLMNRLGPSAMTLYIANGDGSGERPLLQTSGFDYNASFSPDGRWIVFTSERGSPFSSAGFAKTVERAGQGAKLGFKAHPHMLRHACGYALASKGHDARALQAYLGHKNIQHTVRYTQLSPTRFKDFWRK